jgi:NADPH2:quinone reductase
MGAIKVKEFSAPAELTDVPDPQPGPGQVLIPVEAAGMNPMDRFIADGGYQALGPAQFRRHRAGIARLDRVMQAGGHPISWVSLAVALQRDWARQDTVAAVIEIVLTDRLLTEQ